MSTGSGLDAQIGFAAESPWGTAATVTRFPEFNSETLTRNLGWLEPTAIRPGTHFKRGSRIRVARQSVTGDVEFDINTLGMGLFAKHMVGSAVTTPTLIAATAYKQVHTYSAGLFGLGLTCQVGRPEAASGTVVPYTFSGCKVLKWGFMLKDNDTPSLKLTLDGRAETTATALATASFLSGATTFDFSQATLKLGGTATTSGETTIAGGTQVATIIKSIGINGDTKAATDRFGIGNAGFKAQQLQNGIPTITGKLDAEFSKTEIYDLYTNNTPFPLQLDLTGATISGSDKYLFSIILPQVRIKAATPQVKGADIVPMSVDVEAYSDETNPVIQIKIVSTESTTI